MDSLLPFHLWAAFAATQLIFALTPGPAVLLVASQAMARGRAAGVAAALGVQVGNGIYLTLSALGLGAVLAASEPAFLAIKYAGAAYLVVLGVRTIRQARAAAVPDLAGNAVPVWDRPYVQGFVKQLANPKSVLFFGALLPQFVGPDHANAATFVLLGLTCAAIEVPILAGYAWIGARSGRLFEGRAQIAWRERLAGGALIAVGAMVAGMSRAG